MMTLAAPLAPRIPRPSVRVSGLYVCFSCYALHPLLSHPFTKVRIACLLTGRSVDHFNRAARAAAEDASTLAELGLPRDLDAAVYCALLQERMGAEKLAAYVEKELGLAAAGRPPDDGPPQDEPHDQGDERKG